MTNRIKDSRNDISLAEVETCFKKLRGKDLVSVKKNSLMLQQ